MRKLKLQVQQTIDGFVGGLNGEMDWIDMNWDDEIKNYVMALTEPVDCIIMGRKLAEGFIPYWTNEARKPMPAGAITSSSNRDEDPLGDDANVFAVKMNDTPKIVFSKTLDKCPWERTTLAKGDLREEVMQLKKQQGGDIIVYGGANFVSNLIKQNLIDEYHLFINPTAIGKGLSIFSERTKLKLVKSKPFNSGIVELYYEPLK